MKGNSYYTRRIHSLLGVIPLSLFIIEHMLTNYTAFEGGPQGFTDAVLWLNSRTLVFWLELLGIWLPLLFHGVYGLYIAYQSNANTGRYSYGRNWAFTAQRVSGVVTFIFVFWHYYQTRFQVMLGNVTHEGLGAHMHDIVMNPFYFVLYVIGVVAVVFHFSNGMWSFLVSWGITVGPRAQRVSSYVWIGVFAVCTLLFILSLVAFRGADFAETAASADAVRSLVTLG